MHAKVLIIDDDENFRKILRIMLEKEGLDVVDAENGLEGIRKFHKGEIDLVVTDIIMPEKEGIETIFDLREIQPDLKIIAISGGGHICAEEYLDMANNFGVTRSLSKPFEKDEFIKIVREVLEQ